MNIIGDDFDMDEVNFASLTTLVSLIKVIPSNIITVRLSHIVSKISPFFDGISQRKEAGAAMKVFGQMAAFATGKIPELMGYGDRNHATSSKRGRSGRFNT